MSSGVNLYQLAYDPADAADSQKVGAFMLDSAGDELTSTLVGSDQALDINLVQSVALAVTDNGGSLTVDAVDLDIRDLSAATDSVDAWLNDGAGNAISSTGGAIHISDGGGSLTVDGSVTVSATDLDIRDLTHVSDSVKVGDGTDFLAVNSDGSINVSAAALDTVANDELTVGATQVELVAASPVANRRYLLIQNVSSNSIWVGATGVTTADGVEIPKKGNLALDASGGVFAIAAGAGNAVRILELGLG